MFGYLECPPFCPPPPTRDLFRWIELRNRRLGQSGGGTPPPQRTPPHLRCLLNRPLPPPPHLRCLLNRPPSPLVPPLPPPPPPAAPVLQVARLLAAGQVLAVVRGRQETGPQTRGYRSVVALPVARGLRQAFLQRQNRPWAAYLDVILDVASFKDVMPAAGGYVM